jgi:hypothetical protein
MLKPVCYWHLATSLSGLAARLLSGVEQNRQQGCNQSLFYEYTL